MCIGALKCRWPCLIFDMSKKPILTETKDIYVQDSDCCQDKDVGQSLVIRTQDAGGGAYVVIETERWAIDADEVDDFCDALKRTLSRVERAREASA
jgi:hypothetical protein